MSLKIASYPWKANKIGLSFVNILSNSLSLNPLGSILGCLNFSKSKTFTNLILSSGKYSRRYVIVASDSIVDSVPEAATTKSGSSFGLIFEGSVNDFNALFN